MKGRIKLALRRLNVIRPAAASTEVYSPWLSDPRFRRIFDRIADTTLVSPDRCYVLYSLLLQALHLPGDIWECGVYRGGTAALMAATIDGSNKHLHLFDTFAGMPATRAGVDWHQMGDFKDTSLHSVRAFVGHDDITSYHEGLIPDSFSGLRAERIALAHIDVDIYQSVLDCAKFIWPRLSFGGFMVFDDYGFPTCPGARMAVDQFFAGNACIPLCLPTGQAVVFKGVEDRIDHAS